MTNFNNEDDLIKALQGCCPGFLMYQLTSIFPYLPYFAYVACFGL
jgi:hypothetical protein